MCVGRNKSPYTFFDDLMKLFEMNVSKNWGYITITVQDLTQNFCMPLIERTKLNCHSSYTSKNGNEKKILPKLLSYSISTKFIHICL